MILADLVLESWVFWFGWILAGLAFELFAVYTEHRYGTLPLTRVVRDRLMRRSTLIRFVVIGFLVWLVLHFLDVPGF